MSSLGPIRGAIFDLDGTLLDSNPFWEEAPEAWLRSVGTEPRPGTGKTVFAMTLPEAAEYLLAEYALPLSPEAIMDGVNAAMEAFYRTKAALKPGAEALLCKLRARGLPLAIASVTDEPLVRTALRRHGLLEHFSHIVTTAEVGKGKREPDVYLLAAQKLGCSPRETLVFEDAPHGLQTARRAGFVTVGVYDFANALRQEELRAFADFYLPDFYDLTALLTALDGWEKRARRA